MIFVFFELLQVKQAGVCLFHMEKIHYIVTRYQPISSTSQ